MTFYAEIGPAFSSPTRLFFRHSGPPFSVELRTSVIVSGCRSMTDDRTSVRRLLSMDGRRTTPAVCPRSVSERKQTSAAVCPAITLEQANHLQLQQPTMIVYAPRRGAADADASRFPHRASVPCDDVTAAHACVQPEVALITVLSLSRALTRLHRVSA